MTDAEFLAVALANASNAALLERLRELDLPDCYLTAGCLFQTCWNSLSGQSLDQGIQDYDVFYCDERDLSWEAEDAVIRRVAAATADLGVKVEVRNQARVHLWYPARFGHDCPPLRSTHEGIDRFLIACTCVGVEVATGQLYAPHGLDELARGVLRMNPQNPTPALFRAKAESYRARWPWLTIVD